MLNSIGDRRQGCADYFKTAVVKVSIHILKKNKAMYWTECPIKIAFLTSDPTETSSEKFIIIMTMTNIYHHLFSDQFSLDNIHESAYRK